MSAIGVCLRAALRARRASAIALVLLVIAAGGAVLAAAAGARRTASAYPRMIEASNAYDVLVNPAVTADFDAIEAEPQVVDAVRGYGQFVALERDGAPDFSVPYIPLASDGRLGYEVNRPVNLDGRLPRRDEPDEVALSRPLAQRVRRDVGDRLPLLAFPGGEDTAVRIDGRVVGVGLFPNDALQEEDDPLTSPYLFLSPAFRTRYGQGPATFVASLVDLRSDGDIGPFSVAAARHAEGQVFLQSQAESTEKAQRALRPYTAALTAFAIAAGVAAVLVVGQALTRQLLADADSAPTLAALGMVPGQLVAVTVLHAGVLGVLGAVGAGVVAIAASPLMPVGPAHALEPGPGLHVDIPVLAAGVGGIVLLTMLWGAAVGWRVARARAAATDRAPASTRVAGGLARLGLPAPAATGVRMAVEGGRGAGAVPARTTLVGAALGLAALIAAITFGAGLDHLLTTPRLYGWDWDAAVVAGTGEPLPDDVVERVRDSPAVATASEGGYGQLDVDGLSVAGIGLGRGGPAAVHPTLLEGRPAATPQEIVLGTTTLDRIGRRVGDAVDVTVARTVVRARVVGRAVFPKFAAYPGSDRTGLGVGAMLTVEGLQHLIPDGGIGFVAVRFAPDAGRDRALAELEEALGPPPSDVAIEGPHVAAVAQRPDDLVGYDRVGTTPLVLAGLLSLLAVGTTAHGLLTATRRRRRDLSLLKAIGFTRRQVSEAVAWQATTVAVVALLVGVPLGVAGGRWLWSLLADRLGTVAEPVTPALAVLLAVPGTLLLLNLVAAVSGRAAGTVSAATVLRTE